jgi:eukaryotic-like serine/threonine-protein kinase
MSLVMTREDRLADLLERWESAATSGRRPTPEEFCKDTPEDLPAFVELLNQLGMVGLVTNTGKRTSDTQPAGFRAGRYMATEYHAAGGLGVVYRARDEELNRTVALKCMKAAASAESPAGKRFLLEAEVTSQLEHPGIAPVHGRGRTEDGRPFYAMRFIDGETLQDATRRYYAPAGIPAEKRNTELRRLLRAFVGVCETVAYAHSKGVIHRDLKPSNVMVGPFGEVLVMDWGLAKQAMSQKPEVRSEESFGSSSLLTPHSNSDTPVDIPNTPSIDLTVYGRAKGSPSFMSPEQARGEWDRVGPASDIYSLGSTLFYILTGRVPYDGRTSAEVVAKVKDGVFPPARSVNSDVPAALDAICRKAMAFDPNDRYLTAGALADDVERWLADDPVLAWREPFTVRVRRWARRHRTLVTATAAALVVGFLLLAVYGYRLDRKNRDLDLANSELKLANDRERAEREKADERFQNALGSASVLASDIQIKLIRAPGTRAVRESLLQAAIKQLEDLVRKADETRDANRTMVLARLRLGDLYRDVEQNPTKAKGEYLRGLEMARALCNRHPENPLIATDLAETLQRLATVEMLFGHFAAATGHCTEAAGLSDYAGAPAIEQKAKNLTLQGQLALETGDAPTAASRFRDARRIWESRAAQPASDEPAFELGDVLLAQGLTAARTGKLNDASSYYSAALRQWQTV